MLPSAAPSDPTRSRVSWFGQKRRASNKPTRCARDRCLGGNRILPLPVHDVSTPPPISHRPLGGLMSRIATPVNQSWRNVSPDHLADLDRAEEIPQQVAIVPASGC